MSEDKTLLFPDFLKRVRKELSEYIKMLGNMEKEGYTDYIEELIREFREELKLLVEWIDCVLEDLELRKEEELF